MMTVINAREYPCNNTDNCWGDYCALVQLSIRVRAPMPLYKDIPIEVTHWMLISTTGKAPKILTEEEATQARANTFYNRENLCQGIHEN